MQSFSNPNARKVYAKKHFEELMKKRDFWTTQPVPKPEAMIKGELANHHGALEKKTKEEVPQEPYPLPEHYYWDVVDTDDEKQLEELYKLLSEHYVEDDDGYFRFNYSKEFLRWALNPPGYEKDMLIGIRSKETKDLVCFISGIIINLKVSIT